MHEHRLPNGMVLNLVDGVTLTSEEEEVLAAYLTVFVRHEKERLAAQTPRERRAEKEAWLVAARRTVRGRG
jgi:hypothetical protein